MGIILIEDIIDIRIVKKSKTLLGDGIGLVIGGGLAAAIIAGMYGSSDGEKSRVGIGLLVAAAVSGVGAFMGASAGIDETIQIEGMTDSEIQETLDKLRKKVRIRNYQ